MARGTSRFRRKPASLEIKPLPPSLPQREPASPDHSDRLEDRIHADLLDGAYLGEEFTEAPLGKSALLEPREIFRRQIHDRHTRRRILLDAEFPEGHPGPADLEQQIAEILAIDVREIHRGEVKA